MNEIEKRLNATVDILTWLDQRVAQQIEHHRKQEREYWRCHMVDMLASEREFLVGFFKEEFQKVTDRQMRLADLVERSSTLSQKVIGSVDETFERLQRRLGEVCPGMRSADDAEPSSSKH